MFLRHLKVDMTQGLKYNNNRGIARRSENLAPDLASHTFQFRDKQQEFIMSELTQEKLKEVLDYNPETGDFTWRVSASRCIKIGDIAGCLNTNGYVAIGIFRKTYRANRLAWLWMEGYFPKNIDIDHEDQIKHHNRWNNLRLISNQCNRRNCGNPITNTSGVKGICWDKQTQTFVAYIKVNKKLRNLGRYKNFDDAVCARLAGEQCLKWEGCDSNSPAYQYVQKMLEMGI